MFITSRASKVVTTAALIYFMGVGSAMAATRPCPDPACPDPVSKAIQAAAKAKEEIFSKMSKETIAEDKNSLQECLDSIHNFNGINLDIFLPDLGDIMGKICEMATDKINERLDALMGKYTYSALGGMIGGSVGGSTSGSSSTVKVKDVSGSIVGKLGNVINGTLDR